MRQTFTTVVLSTLLTGCYAVHEAPEPIPASDAGVPPTLSFRETCPPTVLDGGRVISCDGLEVSRR